MKKKRVLSLFSGCGGMDLGIEGGFFVRKSSFFFHPSCLKTKEEKNGWTFLPRTSFATVFANDIKESARAAWIPFFKEHRGSCEGEFVLGSVVDLVKQHKKGDKVFPDNIDIVTGGFPCQDFSVAGKRKGFLSHKCHAGNVLIKSHTRTDENRGLLYKWMRDVIDITRPKLFIAENVKGLVSLSNAKDIIANDFAEIGNSGYLVIEPIVLNTASFGVPQLRQRVFFIGFRRDCLNKKIINKLENVNLFPECSPYPEVTHYLPDCYSNSNTHLHHYVTCKEAFSELAEPEESLDLSQKSYSKAKFMGSHCQGQKEIFLELPSPTIRAEHHGNIEFRRLSDKNGGKNFSELSRGLPQRRLTVRECARLQTFPDDYEFVREGCKEKWRNLSASESYKLIGNAVPPLMAYQLAIRIEQMWSVWFQKGTKNDRNTEYPSADVRVSAA